MKGKVKWFSNALGYGFINDETGHEIFVHYTVIQKDGYKTLTEGDEVEFDLSVGAKGDHATAVYPHFGM